MVINPFSTGYFLTQHIVFFKHYVLTVGLYGNHVQERGINTGASHIGLSYDRSHSSDVQL